MATYRGVEIDLEPVEGMRIEAERGRAWREEYNRGGTEVGVETARRILSGEELSRDLVVKMSAYFARHEVDKAGEGWSPEEDGYPHRLGALGRRSGADVEHAQTRGAYADRRRTRRRAECATRRVCL